MAVGWDEWDETDWMTAGELAAAMRDPAQLRRAADLWNATAEETGSPRMEISD